MLTVSLVRRESAKWAPAGHEEAWEQFELTPYIANKSETDALSNAKTLEVTESDEELLIAGSAVSLRFHLGTGDLTSYARSGKEYLLAPARPNFWRAVTDNDLGNRLLNAAACGERPTTGGNCCPCAGIRKVLPSWSPVTTRSRRLLYPD